MTSEGLRNGGEGRGAGVAMRVVALILAGVVAAGVTAVPATAQQAAAQGRQVIELTLERMVELGMKDSYQIRRMEMDIERTRLNLRAERARLKSDVELEIAAPEFQAISEYEWNSTLQRNELVHQNTRRWEVDLSIRQPVILFGWPTDGTLSLNNRMYRFSQLGEERDVRYYNRYFIGYEQPLFQPNRMKNNLEEAEMDLERAELDYQDELVQLVDDMADDYLELFEIAHDRVIAASNVANLEAARDAAQQVAAQTPSRSIELDQVAVTLANAQEAGQQAASDFRLETASLKQRLRLNPQDSLVLDPVVRVEPVEVDAARAIELATTLAPRMRELALNRRASEIDLSETKGNDAFRVDLRFTYGREVQDPQFENLWREPRNSYEVNVNATIPIWDWGRRKYRIRAQEISLARTDLSIEEALSSIQTNVENEVRSLEEYQQRALNMQSNLDRARQVTATTLERYRAGDVQLVDLLQTIEREADTAENFLDAFMGYRRSLLRLQEMTHFDFERNVPVLDRFRLEVPAQPDGAQR